MKKFRSILIWMWLLTKRLYKKPAYLVLLLMVPCVVLAYTFVSQEDSGILTIAIALEDAEDPFSVKIAQELSDSSNIIRFVTDEHPETAIELVHNGTADAAWIIPSNVEQQIYDYVTDSYTGAGFVRVVVREKTVPLMLANEKLSGKLFIQCARICFLNHLRKEAPELSNLTDAQILEYFDRVEFETDLFTYSYVEGAQVQSNAKNYLLMPVRGLLAVLVVIAAIATAMFYIKDQQDGLFSWVNYSKRPWIELGYQIIAISNVMIVVIISLFVAGLNVSVFREIICAVMYIICCAVLGQLLRLWCKNQRAVGMMLPIIVVLMLVICPVFISFPGTEYLQLIFPPSYYLHAVYNSKYLLYMLIYTLTLWIIYKCSAWILKSN